MNDVCRFCDSEKNKLGIKVCSLRPIEHQFAYMKKSCERKFYFNFKAKPPR